MPRALSTDMVRMMNAEYDDDAIVVLITIDHPSLPDAIRVTSEAEETVSDGDTFVPYNFSVTLPDEPEQGQSAAARVQIANVRRDILDALRPLTSPATFDLAVVRRSAPDIKEGWWPRFKLRTLPYDGLSVSGELTLDDLYMMEYPADSYLPIWFPALF
jgi:hypothetical protein